MGNITARSSGTAAAYDLAVPVRTRQIRRSAMLAGGGAAIIGAAAAAYWFIIRPRHLRWGATNAEGSRRWPGDELVAQPRTRAVHAVTIATPPDRIWPWIMQIGRDRGGFYSYTWLENLIGADIHNVYRLMPEVPERRVGDTVWMGPQDRFGGQARMIVGKIVRERAVVLVLPADAERVQNEGRAPGGVWSFALEPLHDGTTRLVMLSLGAETASRSSRVAELLFWEPAHFVMERRMMLTIKRLAETTPP